MLLCKILGENNMTLKMMGTPTDRLNRRDAAKLLGVSIQTVRKWAKEGLLRPIWVGNKLFFSRGDLEDFRRIFNGRTDWSSIAALAMRAFIKAENNERKIEELAELLGFSTFVLDTDDQSIWSFYLQMQGCIGQDPPVRSDETMLIARKCLAMTEGYFRRVKQVAQDEEPWRVFLEGVEYLCAHAPRPYFAQDLDLAAAYGYLDAARRHLRPLAYFYVRNIKGSRVANRAFQMQEDYAAPIVRALYTI